MGAAICRSARTGFLRSCAGAVLAFVMLVPVLPAQALTSMDDSQMSAEAGEGIALSLEQFSFRMAPTSYIEFTGQVPNAAEEALGWYRGDARYYGLSFTGTSQSSTYGDSGMDWYGNGCVTSSVPGATGGGVGNLGCPMSTGASLPINDFASVYNPYVLRVFQYPGWDATGTNCWGCTSNNGGKASPTVLELVGPSNTDNWRFAFWGELEVGRPGGATTGRDMYYALSNNATTTSFPNYGANTNNPSGTAAASAPSQPGCLSNGNTALCGLQSQTIVIGKPVALNAFGAGVNAPSILRVFSLQGVNNTDPTFGTTYQSALSGDFRFSVAQAGSAALHQVPDFDDYEGLFFRNVNAFLPMGRLYYQTLTFKNVAADNHNFVIDLNMLPNYANAYNDFYCGTGAVPSGTTAACATSTSTIGPGTGSTGVSGTGATQFNIPVIASQNPYTHGFVNWGCTSGCAAGVNVNPGGTDTTNGIFFHAPGSGGTVVNLGTASITGMSIQQLTITTLGAN